MTVLEIENLMREEAERLNGEIERLNDKIEKIMIKEKYFGIDKINKLNSKIIELRAQENKLYEMLGKIR